MRSNKIREADYISEIVQHQLIKNQSESLKFQNFRRSSKEMWSIIKDIQGKARERKTTTELTATDLNKHYTMISTDPIYKQPKIMSGPINNCDSFQPQDIYLALTKLKEKTATGPDELQAWFLKISADFICIPVTSLINQSISTGTVPEQWKIATITPIPKTANPKSAADFRPISVTPVLSRLTERLIVTNFITKSICSDRFRDQFAFRPSGSTTSAIIATLKEVIAILENHKYVRLIQLDFSKAFDTVRHQTLFEKLSTLNIRTEIYNWLINFFHKHQHRTRFKGEISPPSTVNCGVIQGSALGPIMFSIIASDLHPKFEDNKFIKYADDTNLIIPPNNIQLSSEELVNISGWSTCNNLNLNHLKSKEIIFKRPRTKEEPPKLPNITRVNEINILGVTVTDKLQITQHLTNYLKKCNSSLYTLKLLKNCGLDTESIHNVYNALVLNRLLYASPAWWGLTTQADRDRLTKYIRKSIRHGYCSKNTDITLKIKESDIRLLNSIATKENHPLRQYVTLRDNNGRSIRPQQHNFRRPLVTSLNSKDFIVRILHDR